MVNKFWLVVTAVAGIAVGAALHDLFGGRTGPADRLADADRSEAPRLVPSAAPVAPAPEPGVVPPGPRSAPRVADRAAPPSADGTPIATFTREEPGETRIALDVENHGNGSPPVYRDSMQVQHEEFVREQRDDSWAYMREAELENLVVVETGRGSFRKDRIECRATICEIDLSASGDQVEKLRKWQQELMEQRPNFPPDAPLFMKSSSFGTENGTAKATLVYVAPQRMMPKPRTN